MEASISDGDKRQAARQPVLKTAKVMFANSVVDCLVLDVSPTGVRVSTETYFAFPEAVTLEFRSGGVWRAVRRWQRGLETGFEYTGFAGLHAAAAAEASVLYDLARNAGLRDVIERLAVARWYDDTELRAAAEGAEAAVRKLERALQVASGRANTGA